MNGVHFAGKGDSDVGKAAESTMPPTAGKGSGNTVDFTGKGATDVSLNTDATEQHDPSKKSVPAGGGVKFAGSSDA